MGPNDVCLFPKHDTLIRKHIGWSSWLDTMLGPGATCNGCKNWCDAPGYKELV